MKKLQKYLALLITLFPVILLIIAVLFSPVQASHHNLTQDLVAYWHLDEASGTRFEEINGYDLTDINTVGQAAGKIDQSAFFLSANNERLAIDDNADLSSGDIDLTIAAWVYITVDKAAHIVGKTGADDEYSIRYVPADDDINFQFYNSDCSTYSQIDTDVSINLDEWNYIIAWHDSVSDTINIQLNNGPIESNSHSGGGCDGDSTFTISIPGSSALDGRVDEVAVWRRLLTEDELDLLWNDGDGLDILYEPPTPTPTPGSTPTPSSAFSHTLGSGSTLVIDTTADFGEIILSGLLLTLVTLFVTVILVRSRS